MSHHHHEEKHHHEHEEKHDKHHKNHHEDERYERREEEYRYNINSQPLFLHKESLRLNFLLSIFLRPKWQACRNP